MNVFINMVLKFCGKHRKALLIGAVLIVVIGYAVYTYSDLMAQIFREKEARSTEQQGDIDEAGNAVNNSANESNRAKENTKAIENANFNGTNLSEAEKLRCKAFPDRCK